jgi:Ca-activated chloride channel homolog
VNVLKEDSVQGCGAFRAPHAVSLMAGRNLVLVPAMVLLSVALRAQQELPTFSANSELVVLQVSVTDKRGAYVEGLTQERFGVVEDGKAQEVRFFADADTPVTVGLLVDSSGSMLANRPLVIAGAASFAMASHPLDEIFALAFNENVRPALPSTMPFTSDSAVLREALESAIAARGRTALYDAISAGVDYLARGTRQRKVLVVLSDGADNASRATRDAAVRKAQASNAAIYTIALVDPAARDANPRLLRELAQESGGESFRPDDPGAIAAAFERIARDIRHTYTLGYTPSNTAHDGAFRRVRVVVTAPPGKSLIVRSRAGYVAGEARKVAP